MERNTIIVHCCGGAGIGVGEKVLYPISRYGEGFANLKFSCIDTSYNNYNHVGGDDEGNHKLGSLFLVKADTNVNNKDLGSGGERKTNLQDINNAMPGYLDSVGIKKHTANTFHCVVSSASGGSGSVIAPILTGFLLNKNIPTFVILIGDSSNGLYTINTLNTLKSYDNIAKGYKKPLLMFYIDNAEQGKDLLTNETHTNDIIDSVFTALSLFASGQNESLDSKDINNMIDQSGYLTLNPKPGIYNLTVSQPDNIKLTSGSIPYGCRTLAKYNDTVNPNVKFQHNKTGYVVNQNALNIIGNKLPVSIIASANFLAGTIQKLDEEVKAISKSLDDVDTGEVVSTEFGDTDPSTMLQV